MGNELYGVEGCFFTYSTVVFVIISRDSRKWVSVLFRSVQMRAWNIARIVYVNAFGFGERNLLKSSRKSDGSAGRQQGTRLDRDVPILRFTCVLQA